MSYLRNLARSLRDATEAGRIAPIELVALLAPGGRREDDLLEHVHAAVEIDAGGTVARALDVHAIDVLFTTEVPRDAHACRAPIVGWIPDFQHVHLPELFTAAERARRDERFAELVERSARIVVSSERARQDLLASFPEAADRAVVLRFAAVPSAAALDESPVEVARALHLPERFLLCPGQLWKHKNHHTVVDALATRACRDAGVVVVVTGSTDDYRHRHHAAEILTHVSRADVRDRFLHVGLVSHAEVIALARRAVGVVQPSLFEGWSSTVEEARALGRPIVASDIDVHREQLGVDARFFSPLDADGLAAALVDTWRNGTVGPEPAIEEHARAAARARALFFAEDFAAAVGSAADRAL